MSYPYMFLPGSVYYSTVEVAHYPLHMHLQAEIVLVQQGYLTLHTELQNQSMGAGEACILFPNQIHGFTKESGCETLLMNFTPDYCPDLSCLLLSRVPSEPVFAFPDGGKEFSALFASAHRMQDSISLYADQACRALTLALCTLALEHVTLRESEPPVQKSIRLILQYCMNHYTEHLTLERMSQDIHISKYHISHLFSAELGTSFLKYVSFLRVSRAKYLLAYTPMSITEAAFSCGFDNQRTFNRVFSKLCGASPREYRNAALAQLTH